MTIQWIIRIALLLGFLLLGALQPAVAQQASVEASTPVSGATSAEISKANQDAEKKWEQLSPAEKDHLREAYQRYDKLSAEQKAKLQDRFKKFEALSPAKRNAVLENFKRFQSLPEATKEKIRSAWKQLERLTPEERRKKLEALRERALRDAERREDRADRKHK